MEPTFLPSKRCLLELKNGQLDAVLSISHVPEREGAGLYPLRDGRPDPSLALRTQRYYWYVLREAALQWDGQQLRRLEPPLQERADYPVLGRRLARGRRRSLGTNPLRTSP